MALKDWKREKSGYRKKSGSDVLAIKYYPVFEQYDLTLNDYAIFHSKLKSKVLDYAKDYMRKH